MKLFYAHNKVYPQSPVLALAWANDHGEAYDLFCRILHDRYLNGLTTTEVIKPKTLKATATTVGFCGDRKPISIP